MDNKRKIKLKSLKKELENSRGPLLKPDIMLITKDVMVPVKVPPPPLRKHASTVQNASKTKSRIRKTERLGTEPLKSLLSSGVVEQNCIKQSLSQVKISAPIKEVGQEIVSKSPFYCSMEASEVQKDSYINETEALSFEQDDLSLQSNSGLFLSSKKDRRNTGSVKISQVKNLLPPSNGDSISSVATSAETYSYGSNKSLDIIEDSLPKLPFSIISSSESEINICTADHRVASQYYPGIVETNNSRQDIGKDVIKSNVVKNSKSEVEGQVNSQNKTNTESGTENIDKVFMERDTWHKDLNTKKESDSLHESHVDQVINDCNKNSDQKDTAKYDIGNNSFEDGKIKTDVEYLLKNLLTNLQTLEEFNSIANCKGTIHVEEKCLQDTVLNSKENIQDDSDYTLAQRVPRMIEFKHYLHDSTETARLDYLHHFCSEHYNIDSDRRYSWQELNLEMNSSVTGSENYDEQSKTIYDNLDVNSNQSSEEIEIKYSWQIIPQKNQELNEVDAELNEKICNEENSKLTSTEDLCLSKPELQYSWQKLTSKYLTEKHAKDNLTNSNQSAQNTNDISKKTSNIEFLNDFSSPRETFIHSSHLNTDLNEEEKIKRPEAIGRIITNSPLNNIIASMLPEMKLFNRRTYHNNTTTKNIGNYRDNYFGSQNKSSISYSSVTSIKHIIASLNEMVTTQKQMLDAYVKNHKLNQNFNVTKPSVNPVVATVEKVEIFPSTLHVIGNYIIRDICPANMNDQRDLLDANSDENVNDNSLSKNWVSVQNTGLNKPVENVLNERIPAAILKPTIANIDLSTRSNDRCSRLSIDVKDTDFTSFLSQPISFGSNYYSTIFAADDNFFLDVKRSQKEEPASCVPEEDKLSSLLPILGNDRAITENNWEPAIAEMEEILGLSVDAATRVDEDNYNKKEAIPHTNNTGPLRPRLQVSLSETKVAAGDSKNREDELLFRLEAAVSRLKQSELHVDANWNLDYSVLDIEERISDKEVQLPNQVEEHIKDIIESAEEYLAKLEEQLSDLRHADDQIINSSEQTFKNIDDTYQLFMDNLCQEINKRRNLVRLETEVFKYEGLAPLRACKQEVNAQIRSTQHLIVLTENMLTNPCTFNKERLEKIISASSHMGRIPAVPMPEELPYVTFSAPNEQLKKEIVDRISCLGCVSRMGPAQFTEVCEQPACIKLKWHLVDPEYASEEQTFIVQKALGEIVEPTHPAFETVYIGPETSCFVREIPVNHPITLRVGIQVSDTAWSVHRIAQTSMPAYSWEMDNSDYLITNSGRIATKITQNLSTLLSRGAQFSANYIIEFKFLEAASGCDDEGIGLVFEPGGQTETLKRNGALLITPNGNIFMNGEQKLMQLPKMELGTRIVFTSEQKDDETMRMTIECANKAVTYDWMVQRPLHFAARLLEHNKWNLMVK